MNTYEKGCLGAAWGDITQSEGWFGRTMLLGLINIVPVLNWVVPGYCMRWSRELVFGRIEGMPKKIFLDRAFINGVFYIVISLLFGIVGLFLQGALNAVPFIGSLVFLAVSFFLTMFQSVDIMRVAMADRLAPAFDLKKVWEVFTLDIGGLFCAAVVPSIIVGLIIGVLVMCVITVFLTAGGAAALAGYVNTLGAVGGTAWDYSSSSMGTGSYGEAMAILQAFAGMMIVLLPVILIMYVIGAILMAFAELWSFRAMGHWIARNASDWTRDPSEMQEAQKYPMP